jgi:hypothetical protein
MVTGVQTCALPIYNYKSAKVLLGFPIVLGIIGISSFFYHASATFVGQFFDFSSIYVLSAYLLFLAIYKRKIVATPTLIIGITLLTLFLCTILWFAPMLRIWLFAGQLLAYLILEFTQHKEIKKKIDYKPLYSALGVFVVAWGIWWLDILYIWNDTLTMHWINGHAVWHIFTAISIYFLYQFYQKQFTIK